jgi:hypothetical protein
MTSSVPNKRRDNEKVLQAYGAAWAKRRTSGDDSSRLLLEKLKEHSVGEHWTAKGSYGRDLLLKCWNDGVPPDRLAKRLRRGAIGAMRASLKGFSAIRDLPWTKGQD